MTPLERIMQSIFSVNCKLCYFEGAENQHILRTSNINLLSITKLSRHENSDWLKNLGLFQDKIVSRKNDENSTNDAKRRHAAWQT